MRPVTLRPWWFRRLVLPAYHDTWAEAEASMLTDPVESRRIGELAEELARNGFQRPVVLGRDHWWSPRLRIGDGVHRSLAAMQAGIPIPVRYGYDETAPYDHSDVYRVTVRDAGARDEGDVTTAILSLSSFRCSAGPWIQCDHASGSSDSHLELYLPSHPGLRSLIAAELQERLRADGIDAVVEFLENRSDDD